MRCVAFKFLFNVLARFDRKGTGSRAARASFSMDRELSTVRKDQPHAQTRR
jgi:hypothetical protein